MHKAPRRWEYTVPSSTRQSPSYPQQACDQLPQHPVSASPSKFLIVSLNVHPYFISYLYSLLKTSLRTIFAYAYKCGICVCGVCIHMSVNTRVRTHSVYVVSVEAPGQHHVSSVCLYFIYWGRVSREPGVLAVTDLCLPGTKRTGGPPQMPGFYCSRDLNPNPVKALPIEPDFLPQRRLFWNGLR